MLADKHAWVCALCGQGFTRKSSAKRHNNGLHLGKAMLVRPYEYIVGRLNGNFSQSDPSLYRHHKKPGMNNIASSMFSNTLRGVAAFTNTTTSVVHERKDGHSAHYHDTKSYGNSEMIYPKYNSTLPSHKQPGETRKPADNIQRLLQREAKLEELQTLAKKLFPPNTANQFVIAANCQATILEDDASLDKNLESLRMMAGQY